MDRRMLEYLPPILQGAREMRAILDIAEQPEFEKAWLAVDTAFLDQFVQTMTEYGLRRWESMLGILPLPSDTLDDRRFRLLTRLNESLPYTYRALDRMLEALCGRDGYMLEVKHLEYTVVVRIARAQKAQFEAVEAMLHRIIPANMIIDLSLMYTQHWQLKPFTHGELKPFTHWQLRNEEVENA